MGRMHSKGYAAQTAAQTAPPAAPPASLPRRRAGAARRCSTAQFFCQCSRPRRRPPALPHAAAPRAIPWQPHAPPSKAPRSHPQICRAPRALPLRTPSVRRAPPCSPLRSRRRASQEGHLQERPAVPADAAVVAQGHRRGDHRPHPKLAKGLTPSQIGVILRDSHGVAQVTHVTGSKILRILKKKASPRRSEDLYCLIKKAVAVPSTSTSSARTRMRSSGSSSSGRAPPRRPVLQDREGAHTVQRDHVDAGELGAGEPSRRNASAVVRRRRPTCGKRNYEEIAPRERRERRHSVMFQAGLA